MKIKLKHPHSGQMDILKNKARFKVVSCGRRFGKLIYTETPIFTFNRGWITVGEVEVGDKLVGSDGKPTNVIYMPDIEMKDGYEFTFSNGEKIIAGDIHDWVTYGKLCRKNLARRNKEAEIRSKDSFPKKLTSQEIVDTFRYGTKKEANHAVPVIPALDFDKKELPIHPYILGCWLGDGATKGEDIVGIDGQIFSKCISEHDGAVRKKIYTKGRKTPLIEYKFYGLKEKLREIGVFGYKHIPRVYLESSLGDRIWLLRGILDTDGAIEKNGSVDLTLKDTVGMLIDDVYELVLGLGIRCSFPSSCEKTATNGSSGNITHCHRLTFSPKDFNPFYLDRKSIKAQKYLDRKRNGNSQSSYRDWIYFIDYEKIPKKLPMRCIGVDADDHLFAVGKTFISTHNTEMGKIVVAETSLSKKGQTFWFSPTYKMSSQIWKDLKQTFIEVTESKSEQERTLMLTGGGELRVFSAENYDSVRGLAPDVVVVDEAAMINDLYDMWNAAIMPALSDKKGRALFLSTPKGENYFGELFNMGNSEDSQYKDYFSYSRPSWSNPYFPRTELIRAKRSTPNKLFEQEYMARFLRDAGEVFIGVLGVATGTYHLPYEGRFAFGIDLGRKNDYTVIAIWDINSRALVGLERFSKYDWRTQKEKIKKAYDKWKPVHCLIEDNSMGDVVIQDLQADGYKVKPFNTSNKSKREIIDTLSVAIQNKTVTLLNDRELIVEFQAFQLSITEKGTITYSAPSGYHDDIVMAAAIGFSALSKPTYFVGSLFPKVSGWS